MRLRSRKTHLLVAFAATALAGASCKPEPEIAERPVVVYSPKSCPVYQTNAHYSVIYGNGDFEDTGGVSSLYLSEVGRALAELPANTRSVIVDVSHPEQKADWRGTAEVPPSGPINVLMWPGGETCRLSRSVQPRTDVTLGVFGRHLMVAGGQLPGQVPLTFVGDLSTGIVDKLEFGLGTRRSHPTITAFRTSPDEDPSPALVAGGEDPDTKTPLATAELYVPKVGAPGDLGDFTPERIQLGEARTKHGAVVLASGETLLVGGLGQVGVPLTSMEIVDPKTKRYRNNGLQLLEVARVSPTVLRLASGEILVAGGFDRSNQPVAKLEWFSADATRRTKRTVDLVTGRERAFVPLAAGGALAVVAPTTAALTDFPTVWVISAEGALEAALPVDPATLERVRLFPGSDGAPVLWTGARWLRWEPWFATFQPIADAQNRGPRDLAIASGDNGLALWLDNRSDLDESRLLDVDLFVRGYRFATRSRFGAVPNPLLVDGPAGLAPDRLAGPASSAIRFVPERGLELGPGASAFVTDVTYASVSVEIDGGPAAPSLVLRQEDGREVEVGGAGCGFSDPAAKLVHVDRKGARVSVRFDGGESRDCPSELDAAARVSIGVRGAPGSGPSFARNLRITRR